MSSCTRRATSGLATVAASLTLLLAGCTSAPAPTGSSADLVATSNQIAHDAEQRLLDRGITSDVTVLPRFTTQTFLLTAEVTFPADLRGDALADAAGSVRRTLLTDDRLAPGQSLRVDSLELTDAGVAGSSARWNGGAVGPTTDAEARLWARVTDAVADGLAVRDVHVWHDDGKPLAVEVLDPSDDSAVPGSDLYTDVLDLIDEAGIDPRTTHVTTWGQFSVSTAGSARLGGHTLAALEALRALPFIGSVQVDADAHTVTVHATTATAPGTDEPLPLDADERSEVHDALDAADLSTTGVTVEVAAQAVDPTRFWPPQD